MDVLKDIFSGVGNVAGTALKGAGDIAGGVAQNVYDASVFGRRQKNLQLNKVNEQFAILKGDFSPEEKENAARQIIQAVQPKLYEQRLRQDPNAKFYQPILSREEQKKKALDPYGRQYGGGGVDPYVRGVEDIGKIQAAREKFVFDKIKPETAAYFDLAEQSVKDRMKSTPTRDNREYFAPRGELDVFDEMGEKQKAPKGELDVFEALGKKKTFPGGKGGTFRGRGATGGWTEIGDYFQAPTETVPESNIPKTYQQLGVTNVDDMFILDEMQKALPDVDLRKEYENDPESIQRLMQLWKARKIDKSNLHKFFSAIQQKARQALGIA